MPFDIQKTDMEKDEHHGGEFSMEDGIDDQKRKAIVLVVCVILTIVLMAAMGYMVGYHNATIKSTEFYTNYIEQSCFCPGM